ncbi:MAG: hypothetical protein AUK35_04185 [Zetaproteobacteria bacterium CG2_30_46_52]|nr:MAG: hypothetical protein AUK35_04185 [Zetaproteobacteria bacterium CG2_30_46_52]
MSYFVIALIVIVLMAVEFSARQLSTVSLDVGISMIRLTLPFIAIVLAQELFSKEFDKKYTLTSLTFPCTRSTWLLSRITAIFLMCAGLLVVMSILLAAITFYVDGTYQQATPIALGIPYFTTLAFVALDLLVIVAIASFLAVSSVTPSFVLIGTFGFTLIARSYTPIIELLKSNPYAISDYVDPNLYSDSLSMIAFILPDLGRLDVRMIALYDKMVFLPSDWLVLVLATFAYVFAIFSLSVWVLNKRAFN